MGGLAFYFVHIPKSMNNARHYLSCCDWCYMGNWQLLALLVIIWQLTVRKLVTMAADNEAACKMATDTKAPGHLTAVR
jgi:hypothetical protein